MRDDISGGIRIASLSKFQVKYKLYVESIYKNGLHGHSSQMEGE